MKLLFVIPKHRFLFFGYKDVAPSTFPHLGVAYLIAALRRHGVEVKLYDDAWGQPRETLHALINEFNPDLIGITVFTLNSPLVYELVSEIKTRTSKPIVLGGVHVSTIKKKVLEETSADFAIKYEGEHSLVELINEISLSEPRFSQIKNLIWRSGGGVIENPDRPFVHNLDDIPFPEFDLFRITPHPAFKKKVLPMVTTRGCPFSCNFCSVNLYMGRGFRTRSPQNVLDELKRHVAAGFTQFDINDDCFTVDRKRAEAILDLIINIGLSIKFRFSSGLRVDTVDARLLNKIKEAGCVYISYGCESGNEEILKYIKKGITLDQVRNAVKWTKKAGIKECAVNFIIGHKHETYQTAMDSISFAKSLSCDYVNFYNLVPYPGTEAYEWVKAHGRFLVDTNNYLEAITYADNQPVFETDELTKEQRQQLIRIGFKVHEFRFFTFRFGKLLGAILYLITRNNLIKRSLGKFSTASRLGERVAVFFSRKSYDTR